MIFSKDGVSPDSKKVQGMMNYISRFIKDVSIISEPLRRLTKKDIDWIWTREQDVAFNSLKEALVEDTCAAYFDVNKTTTTIVDASPLE